MKARFTSPELSHWYDLASIEQAGNCPAEMLAIFASNVGPVWNQIRTDQSNSKYFVEPLRELACIFDEDKWPLLDQLADKKLWNIEEIEKAGRTRPVVYLDAELTKPGNLAISVWPADPFWRWFPRGKEAFARPVNELAFIHGVVDILNHPFFWAEHPEYGKGREVEKAIDRDLSILVLVAFRHCKEILETMFDVELGSSIETIYSGEYDRDFEGCRVMSPDQRRGRDITKAERHAQKEREWKKASAERTLADYKGRAAIVFSALEAVELEGGTKKTMLEILREEGIQANYSNLAERRQNLVKALDLIEPNWRDNIPAAAKLTKPAHTLPVRPPAARVVNAPARASRLTQHDYLASSQELTDAGIASVHEIVEDVNAMLIKQGGFAISQSQYPSTRSKFRQLVVMRAKLVDYFAKLDGHGET